MFAIPRLTPFVKGLLVALIAIYVGVAIVDIWVLDPSEGGIGQLFGALALRPSDLGVHTLWQVVTYPWVELPHPSAVIGFLIGLLFVWWMLSPFEERFGAAWVAKLCAAATISGAIPAIAAAQVVGEPGSIIFGSWVWALAALAAFAAINWSAQVSFFGVIPMRAWVMLAIAIGIAVLQYITSRDEPSFVAQLGAIGGGWLWAKWWMRPRTKPKKVKTRGNGNRPAFRIIQGGREEEEEDDDSGPRDRPRWLN